ncbi:MAG: HAD family hydrolase [Anaerolineae bacterium]|jgi:Cof subfamily protein (haloacid dehalogenase superfamily)
MRRAIAIDLDGTLLDSRRSIGRRSLEMIGEAARRGWPVILCTARPVRAIQAVVPDWFGAFYWAACNGAWVLKDGQILRRVEISHEGALYWIQILQAHGLYFLIEAEDQLFSDQQVPEDFWGACYPLDALGKGGVCKVLVSVHTQEEVDVVRRLMTTQYAYVVTDGGRLVQIAHYACNKLSAVAYILSREGMRLEHTIAFGDDNNDIPLVREAGCGVAMGNATDELKAVADWITGTNDQDGIGSFLESVLSDDRAFPAAGASQRPIG